MYRRNSQVTVNVTTINNLKNYDPSNKTDSLNDWCQTIVVSPAQQSIDCEQIT